MEEEEERRRGGEEKRRRNERRTARAPMHATETVFLRGDKPS